MVYKNLTELPLAIKKLPRKAQTLFMKTYNQVYPKYGDSKSFKIAWAMISKRFKRVNNTWVAKGMGHSLMRFELEQTNNVFVKKGKDGEYFLEGVLSDVGVDADGNNFTENALKNFAKQINEEGISGFISHADFDKFCVDNSHLSRAEFVSKARKTRKGIMKVIKAVFEKGKLWIKAIIDKRYVKRVKQFAKMSIEAIVPTMFQKGNTFVDGFVIGLALDNNASNSRANIARVST